MCTCHTLVPVHLYFLDRNCSLLIFTIFLNPIPGVVVEESPFGRLMKLWTTPILRNKKKNSSKSWTNVIANTIDRVLQAGQFTWLLLLTLTRVLLRSGVYRGIISQQWKGYSTYYYYSGHYVLTTFYYYDTRRLFNRGSLFTAISPEKSSV